MPVGLVCEGPTDQVVLEHLLDGVSGGAVVINAVQPPRPMRHGVDFGGCEQVFASIQRRDVSGALAHNAFVIIQIDTDVCEHANFGVSRREAGRERSTVALIAAVRARLVQETTTHDPTADLTRVVLAICVNELECWLLLHHSNRDKTTGCFDALVWEGVPLVRKGTRDTRLYADAAKGLRRAANIEKLRGRAADLHVFLADLARALPARSPAP